MHNVNKISVFLSSPMPSGDTSWTNLRDSITFLFEHSKLSCLFDLKKIESRGGANPKNIYLKQVQESPVMLALLGSNIPNGQLAELLEAKKHRKIVFAVFLEYDPFKGNGEKDHKVLYDIATINAVRTQYDLFEIIESQMLSFFMQSIDDMKQISPSILESRLSAAIESDNDDLLEDVEKLFSRVNIDRNDDVFLMLCIYVIYNNDIFSVDIFMKDEYERLVLLACKNYKAWLLLFYASISYKSKPLFSDCVRIKLDEWLSPVIVDIFEIATNKDALKKYSGRVDIQNEIDKLAIMSVYSVYIFSSALDHIDLIPVMDEG
ncbi:hypothetical protein CE91St38_19130 [Desulfovibrionaceae bacterium]|nr:hypothetical protein CE91St38_19130 [Desulfovibrionaceae bacterium]GKI12455.1 hypothetical protein CE91St39_19090 [Desulfovibrionaceae bacterium]